MRKTIFLTTNSLNSIESSKSSDFLPSLFSGKNRISQTSPVLSSFCVINTFARNRRFASFLKSSNCTFERGITVTPFLQEQWILQNYLCFRFIKTMQNIDLLLFTRWLHLLNALLVLSACFLNLL